LSGHDEILFDPKGKKLKIGIFWENYADPYEAELTQPKHQKIDPT